MLMSLDPVPCSRCCRPDSISLRTGKPSCTVSPTGMRSENRPGMWQTVPPCGSVAGVPMSSCCELWAGAFGSPDRSRDVTAVYLRPREGNLNHVVAESLLPPLGSCYLSLGVY